MFNGIIENLEILCGPCFKILCGSSMFEIIQSRVPISVSSKEIQFGLSLVLCLGRDAHS